MILKITLSLITLITGLEFNLCNIAENTGDILIQKVNDLDSISISNYEDSYIGAIFYKEINEQYNEIIVDKNLCFSESEEIKEVDVVGSLLGKYYYQVEIGVIGEGYLVGTDSTTNKNLSEMVENSKREIVNGTIQRDYKLANSRSINSMTIGESRNSVVSKKLTWSLDYEGSHYGDFAEWYSSFRILTNNYRYYLIAHESYIAPNNYNTDDFRSSQLIYDFNPNSKQVELRDYQPKAKNPEMVVAYGSDLSAEIGSDGSLKVGAGVSSSYSTVLESPKIYDKGNMANDQAKIEFNFKDPWNETDPWYSYNINQSMQTAIYTIRENRSNSSLVNMTDLRTIQMVRDDWWPWYDKTVNFLYNITYTI